MKKIVIAESIPVINKGEEAILRGIISFLNNLYREPQIIYSTEFYKEDYPAFHNIVNNIYSEPLGISELGKLKKHFSKGIKLLLASVGMKLFTKKIWEKLHPKWCQDYLTADIVLIGHDNLYSESKRVLADGLLIYSLKLCGVKVIALGASIGPYNNNTFLEKLALNLLSKFDLVMLRECYSYNYLQNYNFNMSNVTVGGDMAFLMKHELTPNNQKIIKRINELRNSGKRIIGVALSRALIRKFFLDIDNLKDKESAMLALLENTFIDLNKTIDYHLVFIDHVVGIKEGDYQDDRVLHKILISKCLSFGIPCDQIGENLNAPEIKGVIENLDMILASRTHTMIAAVSTGTLVAALSNQSNFKTHGIIGDMSGLSENILNLDINYKNAEQNTCGLLTTIIKENLSKKSKENSNRLKGSTKTIAKKILTIDIS